MGESANCIAWAPYEYGLVLAAGTAEGKIHIVTKIKDGATWDNQEFQAHQEAVNGLSWAPFQEQKDMKTMLPKRLVSGGSDNYVKVWEFQEVGEQPLMQVLG